MPFERTGTFYLDELDDKLDGCEGLWIVFRKISTMPLAKHLELWVPSIEDNTDAQLRERNIKCFVYHIFAWNIPDDRDGSILPIPSEDPTVLTEEWGAPSFILNSFANKLVEDNFKVKSELNLVPKKEIDSMLSSLELDGHQP